MLPIRIRVGRVGQPGVLPFFADEVHPETCAKGEGGIQSGHGQRIGRGLAKTSDVAIVFVNQPMSESHDARTLSLPDNQDALVSAWLRRIPTRSWCSRPADR